MGGARGRVLARLAEAGALGVTLGVERVRRVLDALGAPDGRFVSVQIAGTNGKGSTAAMTDAILRAAGVRTGLFTSPHLCRWTERIRIDGRDVEFERLEPIVDAVAAVGERLTAFELGAVLALAVMAEDGVEAAVLETGLGGRLDAVTAVRPVAAAITGIGLDHTDVLGGTLAEIAREKAAIARPGMPLLAGELPAEADAAISDVCARSGAVLRRLGVDFAPLLPGTEVALAGAHQRSNAALAVALAREVCTRLGRGLDEPAIADGLRGVRWPGRMEWMATDVLLDCAHNPDGARALAAALPPRRPRILVLSVVRGKDLDGILAALIPAVDHIVATRSRNERALTGVDIAAAARAARPAFAGGVEVVQDPIAALAAARRHVTSAGAFVVVAGSTFLVGDLRADLLDEPRDPPWTDDRLPPAGREKSP